MSIDLDDIESRINEGIYGDDRMTDTGRDDAFAALAVLLAEVERLQSYAADCKSYAADCEQHAKFATSKATTLERAAVVAWLRSRGMADYAQSNLDYAATMIDRGEHRREEKS